MPNITQIVPEPIKTEAQRRAEEAGKASIADGIGNECASTMPVR